MTSPDPDRQRPTDPRTMQMLNGISELSSMFSAVRDSTLGYRKQLLAGDVGPEAADQMTTDYHRALLQLVMNAAMKAFAAQ